MHLGTGGPPGREANEQKRQVQQGLEACQTTVQPSNSMQSTPAQGSLQNSLLDMLLAFDTVGSSKGCAGGCRDMSRVRASNSAFRSCRARCPSRRI